MFDANKGCLNYSDDLDHLISEEISFEEIKGFINEDTSLKTQIINE